MFLVVHNPRLQRRKVPVVGNAEKSVDVGNLDGRLSFYTVTLKEVPIRPPAEKRASPCKPYSLSWISRSCVVALA